MASSPRSRSNCSRGTTMCRMPFIVQIEQLHSDTLARSPRTRNRTWPQWQPPSYVSIMVVLRLRRLSDARLARALVIRHGWRPAATASCHAPALDVICGAVGPVAGGGGGREADVMQGCSDLQHLGTLRCFQFAGVHRHA